MCIYIYIYIYIYIGARRRHGRRASGAAQGAGADGVRENHLGALRRVAGFHEGALAARGCFKYAKPDETLRFEFSTTSKNVHNRLGVKKND